MHQPVDQGRGQGVVHVKDFAPFPEGSIRGDHDRSNFITGGDNLEQQIGPMLVDGQIAQGQRTLKCCAGNNFQKEVVGPTTTSTFHGDAVAARVLLQ